MNEEKKKFWRYENKMIIILCLAFGFVMFDRFAVANLSVYIMADLGMNNTQLGLITSAFALTWSIVGFCGSMMADTTKSRRRLLAITVFFFSIFSMMTGLAAGFISLMVIRLIMGAFEGPVMPVSQSFIIPQSSPERRGLNMGLMQIVAVGLISTLLGPVVQVAMAESFLGWRGTFIITIIPGVIIAILVGKVLVNPDTGMQKTEEKPGKKAEKPSIFKILKNRNIIISMFGTIFLLCWYVCTLTYAPGYLTSVKGLEPSSMSYVMSAFGVGAVVWGIVIPKLSDKFGRKPLVIVAAAMGAIGNIGILLAPPNVYLMMLIAFVGWGGTGVCALMQSTIPAESGDPRFVSTILGSNQLTGELIGASVGATIMGIIGDAFGLTTVLWLLAGCMCVCFVLSFLYKETAPLVLARRQEKQSS